MRKQLITKEQIIKATASIISEKGLENITVDDIAKRAGIAKGSIYLYFKTRDEIFEEAIKYVNNNRIEKLKEVVLPHSSSIDKLKALLKLNQKIIESQPELFLMNYSLMIATGRGIRNKGVGEYFKTYIDYFEEVIKKGIQNKEIIEVNARNLAVILIFTQDLATIFNQIDKKVLTTKTIPQNLMDLISIK